MSSTDSNDENFWEESDRINYNREWIIEGFDMKRYWHRLQLVGDHYKILKQIYIHLLDLEKTTDPKRRASLKRIIRESVRLANLYAKLTGPADGKDDKIDGNGAPETGLLQRDDQAKTDYRDVLPDAGGKAEED